MANPIRETEQKVEQILEKELEKVEKAEKKFLQSKWVKSGGIILAALALAGGFLYLQVSASQINIDTSQISAPLIDLAPTVAGTLNQAYVNVGDTVPANAVVAQVGNELIKSKIAGEIVMIHNDIGKIFTPGQAVVTMIDPSELRVVGTIDENKGLSKIHVGQIAEFTVDAFGSKKFDGVVDEVSPTSHQSDVVFNISDQRQIQQFDVKIRFNQSQYPELKNGMSAKLTIYIK